MKLGNSELARLLHKTSTSYRQPRNRRPGKLSLPYLSLLAPEDRALSYEGQGKIVIVADIEFTQSNGHGGFGRRCCQAPALIERSQGNCPRKRAGPLGSISTEREIVPKLVQILQVIRVNQCA